MSQSSGINAGFGAIDDGRLPAREYPQLRSDNIHLDGSKRGLGRGLMVAGAIGVAAGLTAAFFHVGGATWAQGVAAYHIATMSVLAICLGALFFVLVFQLLNAGWTGTVRRQFENVMSFLPYAFLLIIPTLLVEMKAPGNLFRWMDPLTHSDILLQEKASFFFFPLSIESHGGGHGFVFPAFFAIRAVLYGVVWTYLARRMWNLSVEQDRTGDRWLTAKARFTAAWGILIFALTTAFAAFDWLMSLDFRFFSTMWGIYFFAGAAFSSVALVSLILLRLKAAGKLVGAVTEEHFHDLGKLMFAFTVFWTYIAFSQYFLIWYANIPEETTFFIYRKQGIWNAIGIFLVFGHFVAPFLILMSRIPKKNPKIMTVMAVWAVLVHVVDIFWLVRPMVYASSEDGGPGPASFIVDIIIIIAVLLGFAGYLISKVSSGPLIAKNDPRMEEALEHRNYV